MSRWSRITLVALAYLVASGCAAGCGEPPDGMGEPGTSGAGLRASGGIADLMQARNLTEADVVAALKTYTPSGRHDDYYMFASSGHAGQVIVIGIPSMRILRTIATFTPESWQGYGFGDETEALLQAGSPPGSRMRWGDTHHPGLSETNGEYDGQFLFIGDKASARIAVIDLKDFTVKQIAASGVIQSEHGASFVTPNTEYVVESSQYPAPLGGAYADLSRYNEEYRGAVVMWKFDREKGRIDRERSFAIELPPYMQDLADAGKGPSDGFIFINSFNTERATGGNMEGKPPLESGASQSDTDFLHVVDWKKAEQVAAAGKHRVINGMKVISLDDAVAEGLLYFVPEPKSPHGVDVTPNGDDVVVGGKLDTHATVYSIANIKRLIAEKRFQGKDPYGVPILPLQEAMRGQCELGLGPLHTVYDDKGFAYTSLFIESKVAKWSLADLKVVEKLPVHYNIGHLAAAEGDSVSPDGKYLVALNKWALDRFAPVGPLLPQNLQLVDLSTPQMTVLADMPMGVGEPHYAQIIKADKLKPIEVYKPAGTNPLLDAKDPFAVEGGKERIERRADGVHVFMTAVRSHFTPDTVRVRQGDTVHFHITNIEQAKDATHGFSIADYNLNLSLEPGKHSNATIVADRPGVFPLYCTEFCSALHLEMAGYLLVEPK